MQNQPPNPQQYPPNYNPPYTQPTSPNYSAYTQPLPPAYPPNPHYPQSQDNSTAIVLEAVCSVFGLYGIGWLFRGRIGMGVGLLALGFVWIAFAVIATFFTFGLALICLGPLHVLFIVGDVLMLNSSLRQP